MAAEKGHLHCLNLLLDYGGKSNYFDTEGNSPIDYAHRNQNILCEHLLLRHLGMLITYFDCIKIVTFYTLHVVNISIKINLGF